MGLFGDLVIGALGGFPEKPSVPTYEPTDVGTEARRAVTSNLNIFPESEKLASEVDTSNLTRRLANLERVLPGFGALLRGGADTLASFERGELPPDLLRSVVNSSAARAQSGGYGATSPIGANLITKDILQNSLDLQKFGLAAMPGYLSGAASILPQPYNVASNFVTTPEAIDASFRNQSNLRQRNWLKSQLDALPDPGDAAIARDVGGIADLVGSAALGALGYAAGGSIGGALGGEEGSAASAAGAAAGQKFGASFGSKIGGGTGGGGLDIGQLMKMLGYGGEP